MSDQHEKRIDHYGTSQITKTWQRLQNLESMLDDQRQFVGPVESLKQVQERIVRAAQQREQRELIGAWRAGYEYLYKIHPIGQPTLTNYVPSNLPDYRTPSGHYVERLDIGGADDEEIKKRLGL